MSELETNLKQFTGTEHYYRHLGGLLCTDGVQYLAEKAGAYWLLDLIASYQPNLKRAKDERLKEMQFWHLKVNDNQTAVVTCVADTDEPPAVTQQIPFTDFPLSEIDVWVVANGEKMVAMLKTEY